MHSIEMDSNTSSVDPFRDVLREASARAQHYLGEMPNRHVGIPQSALDRLPALGGDLPEEGLPPQSVLKLLDEVGSPATMLTLARTRPVRALCEEIPESSTATTTP